MLSVLLATGASLSLAMILTLLGGMTAARPTKDFQKMTPFECGFDPYGTSRGPFSLQFFLLAVIFLLFDMEIALLYPLITLEGSLEAYLSAFTFILILFLGLLHEWNEGSLQWKS